VLLAGNIGCVYGDVLEVRRVALGMIPYRHFGVEMPGGGICENSPAAGVRVVTLADFARGGPALVRNHSAGPEERVQTVERAASRVGERRYSLSGNNCEHFANWCATGAAVSYQVLAVARQVAAIFGAFLRAALVAAFSLLAVSVAEAVLAE
jgi:lecithin:retinol acyltransferase